jgi:hypothetical protein
MLGHLSFELSWLELGDIRGFNLDAGSDVDGSFWAGLSGTILIVHAYCI